MTRIPKNLRQVGEPEGNLSIYIEDYVFTYLKSEYNSEAAILIGESTYEESGIRVVIRGAISCPQLYWQEGGMEMPSRTWNYIYREREHMYPGQDIVGWYLPIPSDAAEKHLLSLAEFHGKNFPGIDKVFFYINPYNNEEGFYVREGHLFKRQKGYFIFYEKNAVMREYMLSLREQRQLESDLYKEIHDKPREVMRYREYINNELEKKHSQSGLAAYVLSVLAMASVFVLVIGIVSGYNKANGENDFLQTFAERTGFFQDNDSSNQESAEEKKDSLPDVVQDGVEASVDAAQENMDAPANTTQEAGGTTQAQTEMPSIIEGTQFDDSDNVVDPEVEQALSQGFYVVKQGESLAAISRKLYGTDEKVSALCQKNGIVNPDAIFPGQTLNLP